MIKKIKKWIALQKIKKAIKKAEEYYKETRYHALVLKYNGKYKVFSRKHLKSLVKAKFFKCSLETLEKSAIYKTY